METHVPALQSEYLQAFNELLARRPTFARCRISQDSHSAPEMMTEAELQVFPFDSELYPHASAAWLAYNEILQPWNEIAFTDALRRRFWTTYPEWFPISPTTGEAQIYFYGYLNLTVTMTGLPRKQVHLMWLKAEACMYRTGLYAGNGGTT